MPFVYDDPLARTETPASSAASPSRAAGASYAEGAAGQSPAVQAKRVQAKEEKPKGAPAADPVAAAKEKERAAAAKKSYEQLLGGWLGGKLYELVKSELSADKILGYGQQGLDSAIKSGTGLIKPVDGFGAMDEASEAAAVQALAKALAGWGKEKANEWLKSDDGKAFRTKIGQWFEGHPGVVVGLALVAAAGAVAANVALPELKQKFDLGNGLSANLGADLNKIRDIVLKSVSVGLSYQNDDLKAGLSYKYGKGDDTDTHSINAFVNKGDASLKGTATIQGDRFVLNTNTALTKDGYSLGAGLKHTRDANGNTTLGNVNARLGDKDHNVSGNAAYDFSAGTLSFGLNQFHNLGNVNLRSGHTYSGEKGMTHNVGADFKLQKQFKASLDYAMSEQGIDTLSAKASATFGQNDEWSAAAAAKFNLTDGELQSASAKFGFRDKNEFQSFLVSYSRTFAQSVATDKLSLMVETSVRDVMIRGQHDVTLTDGRVDQNLSRLHLAHEVSNDVTLFGGVKHGFQNPNAGGLNANDRGTWLEAGVQFRKIPFVVGFRPEDKAVTFGLTIPFGR